MDPNVQDRITAQLRLADILGYVAPGAAFLLSAFFFESWVARVVGASSYHLPFSTALYVVVGDGLLKEGWFVYIIIGIALLLGVYIMGHIIDSFSVLIIERLFVSKGYGYPYQLLLRPWDQPQPIMEVEGGTPRPVHGRPAAKDRLSHDISLSRAYYRGLIFWVNLYLALRLASYLLVTLDRSGVWGTGVIWGVWIVGWLLVFIVVSKVLLSTARTVLKRHRMADTTVEQEDPPGMRLTIIVLHWIYAGPSEILFGRPLSKVIATRKAYDDSFRRLYFKHFKSIFNLDPDAAESNHHWMVYAYVLRRSRRLFSIVAHWEMLYTFSRNLATAFYLAFLYCLGWLFWHSDNLPQPHLHGGTTVVALPGLLLMVSIALLIHYYYLYVGHYSKFLFRAFVLLAETSRPSETSVVHGWSGQIKDVTARS